MKTVLGRWLTVLTHEYYRDRLHTGTTRHCFTTDNWQLSAWRGNGLWEPLLAATYLPLSIIPALLLLLLYCCSSTLLLLLQVVTNLPAAQHRSWLGNLVSINSIIGGISKTDWLKLFKSSEHICFYSRLMKVLQGYNGLIFCHVCFRRVTNVTIGHGGGQ